LNPKSSRIENSPARFFYTMVVMGGALALGCGGMSNRDEHTGGGRPGGTPSGAGTGGGGGSGGGGSGSGSGGSGVIIMPEPDPDPVTPGPFVCVPAQWDCSAARPQCYGSGFALPENCRCDETRPKSEADCPVGQAFTCRVGTADAQGRQLTEVVPFECSCATPQPTCNDTCSSLFGVDGNCRELSDSGRSILFDCAIIVLR